MREQRQQAQDRHHLELQLLALMRDTLGQAVQPQKGDPQQEDHDKQEDTDADQQSVALPRCGNEWRQVVRRQGIDLVSHDMQPFRTDWESRILAKQRALVPDRPASDARSSPKSDCPVKPDGPA